MQHILSDARIREVALCQKCKKNKLEAPRIGLSIELCPAHRIKAKQR
jgi:hypothetical protein